MVFLSRVLDVRSPMSGCPETPCPDVLNVGPRKVPRVPEKL
jgi:hypothetical protein